MIIKKNLLQIIYSLAQAFATIESGGVALPFGIYLGDKPIGFLMIGYSKTKEEAKLFEDGEILDFTYDSYSI